MIDVENPYTHNNLGLVMAKLGDIELGFDLIRKSIDLHPGNSYAYKNRAKLHIMNRDYKRAKNDLLEAERLDYASDYDNEVEVLLAQVEREIQD